MAASFETPVGRLARWLRRGLSRIEFLALYPLITILAAGFGGADLALVTATVLPALLALQSLAATNTERPGLAPTDAAGDTTGPPGKDSLLARLDHIAAQGQDTACILIQIDDYQRLVDLWGGEVAAEIASRACHRLSTSLRSNDLVARLGDARFGIVLHPPPVAAHGLRETVVNRLRGVMSEAFAIGGGSARLTISAGHSNIIRDADAPAAATFAAAEAALAEAHRDGPDAVRAFAPGLQTSLHARHLLSGEVESALAAGDIRPWFQPQVRCDTGAISGFEALARWHHAERGVLAPGQFLPAVADAGCMEALGHNILFHALDALRAWDAAGLRVPSVSVNFSTVELRNPRLVDHVKWEIDRFDMRPGRLTVEILETVAAESRDTTVVATISALAAHGVNLDLDDFGIGQASLSAIRRFGVSRIKIDRSFINGLEDDPEQQSMVSAILSMARHLGVETLAEGVETEVVRDLLARMGCNHIQGYLVARPMPFDQASAWTENHKRAVAPVTQTGKDAG